MARNGRCVIPLESFLSTSSCIGHELQPQEPARKSPQEIGVRCTRRYRCRWQVHVPYLIANMTNLFLWAYSGSVIPCTLFKVLQLSESLCFRLSFSRSRWKIKPCGLEPVVGNWWLGQRQCHRVLGRER